METNGQASHNLFEGWTTIEEAAEMIGRGNATVRGWANKGWIRCFAVGRKVRLVNIDEVNDCARERPPLKRRELLDNHKMIK